MSASVVYGRFLNVLRGLGDNTPTGLADLLAVDELLVFIQETGGASDSIVRVVDVVRAGRFGTPPTVIKRLQEMEAAGWIEAKVAKDRRAKSLSLSRAGLARLRDRATMMRKLVQEAAA
jgi:hypothetical protein